MNWRRYKLTLVLAFVAGLVVHCSVVPKHPEFNVVNCSKIKKNMTVEQIESMFGKPDKVEMDFCGPEGQKFSCMIYKYEMGYGVGRYNHIMNDNTLYFSKTMFLTEITLNDGTTITVDDPKWRSMGFPDPLVVELESWTLYLWNFHYVHPV